MIGTTVQVEKRSGEAFSRSDVDGLEYDGVPRLPLTTGKGVLRVLLDFDFVAEAASCADKLMKRGELRVRIV
jgi:hypothetical protein